MTLVSVVANSNKLAILKNIGQNKTSKEREHIFVFCAKEIEL
jgi:hypothetical protein